MQADARLIRSVFLQAVEAHRPDEWEAYLDEACADDAALRERVEILLRAHAQSNSLLDTPAAGLMATIDAWPAERSGTMIGAYKLVEQIGEGGMGLVFVAEQQRPVRRKVALKLIKPGLDTREVIARFEAERQALALMDHPHIARVFDAGATEAGRPYFVMELVHGVPITDYCDQSQLSTDDRLKLFLAVCRAVQHAHQKGIIHRDIKPSNILVTLHDGVPVVKVIDFGVAKAVSQQLTEKTIYTAFSQMVGTPLYMSPEQAGMSGLDIDTRSDIYSLGVVLYELLTGTTPFENERLRGVNLDEIRRMLREEEPPKPSTRINTLGVAATTLSTQRGSDPRRLSQLFRGELDWIVMKALEKDRNRRYDTAAGLAADIERHLNDEPVLACPPSTWYRFRKVARRNKRALLTAAALCGTVMAGLVLMSVSYLRLQTEQARTAHEYDRAETERAVADEQRAEAESRLKLVLEALGEVYIKQAEEISTLRQQANESGAAADPRREQAEREFLEKGLLFYEKLARRPGASPEAQAEMGRALHTVSVIRSRLGHNEESARAMRQAALLFENLTKQFPEVAYYALEQADAWHWLYHPLSSCGRYDEAEQATRTALAIFRKLPGNLQADLRTRRCMANCYDHLTRLGARRGRLADALRDFKLAEQAYEQLTVESPLETEYRANLLHLRVTLAPCFAASGQPREAAAFFSAAAAGFEKLVAETAVDGAARTTTNGRPSGTQDNAWYRFELGFTCVSQGDLLRQLGQLTDAEATLWRGLKVHESLVADVPGRADYKSRLPWNELKLADVRKALGQRHDAEQGYRKAAALLEQAGLNDAVLGEAYEALGELYREDGRVTDAVDARRKAVAACEKLAAETNEGDHWLRLAGACQRLGALHKQTSSSEDAEAAYLKAEAVLVRLVHAEPDNTDYRFQLIWNCQTRSELIAPQGRLAEAAEPLLQLADVLEKRVHDSPKEWHGVQHVHQALADNFVVPGRVQEGAKIHGVAIERTPHDPHVWERRIEFYTRLGLWDLAARDDATAFGLEPAATAHRWLSHALLSLQSGDSAAYLQICQRLPKLFSPETDYANWENGLVRACTVAPSAATDIAWAVRMGEKAVERHPQEPWNQFALGLARYRAGDDEGAIASLDSATDWLSGGASCPVLAMAYHRLGREHEARESLHRATQAIDSFAEECLRSPTGAAPMWWWDLLCCRLLYREAASVVEGSAPCDDVRLIAAQARAWAALGESKAAKEACRRAIQLGGGNLHVCLATASIYAELGERQAAEAALTEAIRLKPGSAEDRRALGIAAAKLGKYSEAIEACREALRLAPDQAVSHNHLAWYLATCADARLREPHRAVELATRAVELDPARPDAWNTLGVAQYRAGDWKAVVQTLTKSTELRPGGDGVDHFFLAMAHWQLGEAEEARKWYSQAVEWMDKNQPNNEELRRFRAEAAELLGKSDASQPNNP